MLQVVEAMPHTSFMLIAPKTSTSNSKHRNWRNWALFPRLSGLPNFEYIEADYDEYPHFIQKWMSTFQHQL